jgi:mycofactocin precursor
VTTIDDTAVPRAADLDRGADTEAPAAGPDERDLVEDELLVEDVSIDGMCGVY